MNIYLKHYKNTQLVVTDDLLGYGKSEEESGELLQYAIDNGITLRDDSPLVEGYIENELDTWTVRHPGFFEAAYLTMPTVFEMEHYGKVKSNGFCLGPDGEGIIPGYGVSGAQIFREAMNLIHPTYVGFHGYLGDWLEDNPALTREILNRCGYWYFPVSVGPIEYKGGELSFEMEWINRGVAPAYRAYQLKGKLIAEDKPAETINFTLEDSGNLDWMPDQAVLERYTVSLPDQPKGTYQLAIQLMDPESGSQVEIGLQVDSKREGYHLIREISF